VNACETVGIANVSVVATTKVQRLNFEGVNVI
jgi:hypothetical protein